MANQITWTEEMVSYLKDNYQTMFFDDMARELGVSVPSISTKLRSLGLKKDLKGSHKPAYVWNEADIDYLREHYPFESVVDIAEHLGIKYHLVLKKSRELGLQKSTHYDRHQFTNRYVKRYRHRNNVTLEDHIMDVA